MLLVCHDDRMIGTRHYWEPVLSDGQPSIKVELRCVLHHIIKHLLKIQRITTHQLQQIFISHQHHQILVVHPQINFPPQQTPCQTSKYLADFSSPSGKLTTALPSREKQQTFEEEYQSESDEGQEQNEQQLAQATPAPRQGKRTMQRAPRQQQNPLPQQQDVGQQQIVPAEDRMTGHMGGRTGAIRESRIKDRPQPAQERDSSLKIKIELDLEVEVDLYARVKGDVTIGLM